MARLQPSLGELVGLGVVAGLAASIPLGPEFALPLAALGAGLGAAYSYLRVPDAPVCRIWRIFGGCGGSTVVRDKRGNTGAPVTCWAHRGGKPKRLVNLVAVPVQVAAAVGLVVLLVTVAGA